MTLHREVEYRCVHVIQQDPCPVYLRSMKQYFGPQRRVSIVSVRIFSLFYHPRNIASSSFDRKMCVSLCLCRRCCFLLQSSPWVHRSFPTTRLNVVISNCKISACVPSLWAQKESFWQHETPHLENQYRIDHLLYFAHWFHFGIEHVWLLTLGDDVAASSLDVTSRLN